MTTLLKLNVNKQANFHGDANMKNASLIVKDASDDSKITLSSTALTSNVAAEFTAALDVGATDTKVLSVKPGLSDGDVFTVRSGGNNGEAKLTVKQSTVSAPHLTAGATSTFEAASVSLAPTTSVVIAPSADAGTVTLTAPVSGSVGIDGAQLNVTAANSNLGGVLSIDNGSKATFNTGKQVDIHGLTTVYGGVTVDDGNMILENSAQLEVNDGANITMNGTAPTVVDNDEGIWVLNRGFYIAADVLDTNGTVLTWVAEADAYYYKKTGADEYLVAYYSSQSTSWVSGNYSNTNAGVWFWVSAKDITSSPPYNKKSGFPAPVAGAKLPTPEVYAVPLIQWADMTDTNGPNLPKARNEEGVFQSELFGTAFYPSPLAVQSTTTYTEFTAGDITGSSGKATLGQLEVTRDAQFKDTLTVTTGLTSLKATNVSGLLDASAGFTTSTGFLNVTSSAMHTGNNKMIEVNDVDVRLGSALDGAADASAITVPHSSGDVVIRRNVDMTGKMLKVNDIEVTGTMTTKNSEEVNIGDNHIHLNAFGATDTAEDSGIVSTCKQVATPAVASIQATGTIKLNGDGLPSDWNLDDEPIVQVYDSSNPANPANGLYQITGVGNDDNVLTTKTTGQHKFCKSSVPTGIEATGVNVVPVEVSHLYFFEGAGDSESGAHGTIKYGHGHGKDMEYVDLSVGDIAHSYQKVVENGPLVAHVTEVTGGNAFILPTGHQGDSFKVINNTADNVTVSATLEDGAGAEMEDTIVYPHSMSTFYKGENKYFVSA